MRRDHCERCELLREYYRLKANRFFQAVSARSVPSPKGAVAMENELRVLKDDAIQALCALISHMQSCYQLDRDLAA